MGGGTKIYLNETRLNETITSKMTGKLDVTDQRYNETNYINTQLTNYVLNTGDTIDGSLIINGNLTIIGNYVNATVENQYLNGSFYPQLNNIFDIGSSTSSWQDIYATNFYGNLNASYITNEVWLTTESDSIFVANNVSIWSAMNAKAKPGTCAAGTVVQNTTTSGVQCVASTISESDPIYVANNASLLKRNGIVALTGNWFAGGTYNISSKYYIGKTKLANLTGSTSTKCTGTNVVREVNLTSGALTIDCVAPTTTESDPIFVSNNVSIWSGINAKLAASDQRYNDTVLANTKSKPGICSTGQVVQNTTTSGVQCVTSIVTESDPIYVSNNVSIWSGINAKLALTDQRYNDTVLANAKALPGICSGIQVVQNTTTTGVKCITPTITEADPIFVAGNTSIWVAMNAKAKPGTCAAGQVVQNTTTSGVQCVTTSVTESDPIYVANNVSIWAGINAKLAASDQRYNDTTLANAKALPGVCAAGTVVQNTTTSGVQCVTPTAVESDPIFVSNNASLLKRNGIVALTGNWFAGGTYNISSKFYIGKTKLANVTGTSSSTACSGTDKVTQATLTNGVISTTCAADQSGGSSAVYLASTLKSMKIVAFRTIFTIPLTINTLNLIEGRLIQNTSLSGAAVQNGANLSAAQSGICTFVTQSAVAAQTTDNILLSSTITGETGETAIPGLQPAMNVFYCAIRMNGVATNLLINFQGELVTANVSTIKGSYYTKSTYP